MKTDLKAHHNIHLLNNLLEIMLEWRRGRKFWFSRLKKQKSYERASDMLRCWRWLLLLRCLLRQNIHNLKQTNTEVLVKLSIILCKCTFLLLLALVTCLLLFSKMSKYVAGCGDQVSPVNELSKSQPWPWPWWPWHHRRQCLQALTLGRIIKMTL